MENIHQELNRIFAAAARDTEERPAAVSSARGVQCTEYGIKGTLESVLKVIRILFEQYPSAGYGTYLHSMKHDGEQYVARMSRGNSCE